MAAVGESHLTTIEVHPNPSTDSVAGFLGIETDELGERDRFQQPIYRWLALEERVPVGLAPAFVRPDNRLFLSHRHHGPALYVHIRGLSPDAEASLARADWSAKLSAPQVPAPLRGSRPTAPRRPPPSLPVSTSVNGWPNLEPGRDAYPEALSTAPPEPASTP